MKNISRKKNDKQQNVLNISDNPRFKPIQTKRKKLIYARPEEKLQTFTAGYNEFQFQKGDILICRDFSEDEMLPGTALVISEKEGVRGLTVLATASNPVALVVAFQREVAQ